MASMCTFHHIISSVRLNYVASCVTVHVVRARNRQISLRTEGQTWLGIVVPQNGAATERIGHTSTRSGHILSIQRRTDPGARFGRSSASSFNFKLGNTYRTTVHMALSAASGADDLLIIDTMPKVPYIRLRPFS